MSLLGHDRLFVITKTPETTDSKLKTLFPKIIHNQARHFHKALKIFQLSDYIKKDCFLNPPWYVYKNKYLYLKNVSFFTI